MPKSKTTKKKKASSANWDFSNDPFVLEKVRQGKELIAKYGLPKELSK